MSGKKGNTGKYEVPDYPLLAESAPRQSIEFHAGKLSLIYIECIQRDDVFFLIFIFNIF